MGLCSPAESVRPQQVVCSGADSAPRRFHEVGPRGYTSPSISRPSRPSKACIPQRRGIRPLARRRRRLLAAGSRFISVDGKRARPVLC